MIDLEAVSARIAALPGWSVWKSGVSSLWFFARCDDVDFAVFNDGEVRASETSHDLMPLLPVLVIVKEAQNGE